MRYFKEYRHKFTDAPGLVIDAGKKLLGYLSNQKRLSGVDSLIKRIEVKDASNAVWVVEARFDKGIPSVRIFPPNNSGEFTCELYVESGMLDLGPNIASDASERFNRGLPSFAEGPATLYFGTGVECVDGEEGLNGTVNVIKRALLSECLPSEGNGIPSRLTDPVKKQAQATLPASCWSGLMHRYVAAVYGGDTLDYSATSTTLTVEGVPIGHYTEGAWGLVQIEAELRFVSMSAGGSVQFFPLKFKTECGQTVFRAWQARRDQPYADKLLTIALSTCYPDVDNMTVGATEPALAFTSTYAWQFCATLPEAHSVRYSADSQDAVLLKAAFTAWDAAFTVTEQTPLPPPRWGCVIGSPGYSGTVGRSGLNFLAYSEVFDAPIHCYYDGADLVVLRQYVESQAAPVVAQEGRICEDGINSWPTPLLPDAVCCSVTPGGSPMLSTDTPGGYNSFASDSELVKVSTGLFAKKGATTLWSTVEEIDARSITFTETGGGPGEVTYIMKAAVGGYINLLVGESYDETVAYDFGDNAGVPDLPYGRFTPWNGAEGGAGPIALPVVLEDPEFLQTSALPTTCRGDRFGHTRLSETGTPNIWEAYPGGHFMEEGAFEGSVSCTVPCAYGYESSYRGYIMLGATNYLELPRGDVQAAIALLLNVKGARQYLGHAGYEVITTGPHCNDVGTCSGTKTVHCLGDGGGHAAHDVTLSLTAPGYANHYMALDETATFDSEQEFMNRVHVLANAIVVSGGAVVSEQEEEGQFEEHVSGDTIAWQASHDAADCPIFHALLVSAYTLPPTAVDGPDGATSLEEIVLDNGAVLHNEFDYMARRSLLGATTYWTTPLQFGNSVGMDRETLTGGYSPVSTPSFVGWA